MRSANAQTNLEKSVVGVPLKYTRHDPLALKEKVYKVESGRQADQSGTWASPNVTYCPSDNLIYYIGRDDAGNFGLCTFRPIFRGPKATYSIHSTFGQHSTERALEFDKKPFDYEEDLTGDISTVGHFYYLKYSLPRDLVFSHFDNAIYLLFHEHIQTYNIKKFEVDNDSAANWQGGYTGIYYLHSVNSETKFILKKFDLDKRQVTLKHVLSTIAWEGYAENYGTSDPRQELLEPILGRVGVEDNYSWYSEPGRKIVPKTFPPYLFHIFNSLSVNPRKGEIIVLHSEKGHGLQHIKSWTMDYAERFRASSAQELKTAKTTVKTGTVFDENGVCKTARNCTEWEVTPSMGDTGLQSAGGGPFWFQGAHGTSWAIDPGVKATGESPDTYNCDGAKDWDGSTSWTLQDCDCCITIQDPEGTTVRGARGGSVPRKLIYCPVNDSFYNSSNFESTQVASVNASGKSNFNMPVDVTTLLNSDAAAATGKVIDGIYVPTEKKLLYLSFFTEPGTQTACILPPCPPPTPPKDRVFLSYVDPAYLSNSETGKLYNEVSLSKEIPVESPESLIFCPSNNKIYILAGGTILRVRVSDLVIEKSIDLSSVARGAPREGKILRKAFLSIYSPINDVIYYVSTDEHRLSFVLDVNHH